MKYYSYGMKSILSEKGQVTIPKTLRRQLGLVPGTVIDFEASDGRLVGRKQAGADVVGKWRGKGTLPGGMSVDEYIDRCRS